MNRLESIEAREAAATEGPWTEMTYGHKDRRSQMRAIGRALDLSSAEAGVTMTDLSWVHQGDDLNICLTGNGPRSWHNGQFIAHARTDIPALLAVARAAARYLFCLDAPQPHGFGDEDYYEAGMTSEEAEQALRDALRPLLEADR